MKARRPHAWRPHADAVRVVAISLCWPKHCWLLCGSVLDRGWLGAAGWPVFHGLSDTPSQTKPLFTSLHPGIVMFATADGAVRGLSFTIEQETLNALAGMADGQTVK